MLIAALLRLVGNLTAGDPPVPIPNTEVKPRWADGTARESVWESRSLPALIKATFRNERGLFLFVFARGQLLSVLAVSETRRIAWYCHGFREPEPRSARLRAFPALAT